MSTWRSMFKTTARPQGGQGDPGDLPELPMDALDDDAPEVDWHPTPLGRIYPGDTEPGRYDLSPSVLSQGPRSALEALLADDSLEEVIHNGSHQPMVVYHRRYGVCGVNLLLPTEDARAFLEDVAIFNDREICAAAPLLEGNLPDGSRICATLQPITEFETFTVRKQLNTVTTLLDILRAGALSAEAAAFLWCAVDGFSQRAANLLVVGGSATGKTTMLNALLQFVPANQRIVTIEDVRELRPRSNNHVALRSSAEITMDMLLKNALRQRPDRICVGEVRGEEARVLFTAMNTGHQGCMGTIHARSVHRTVERVTNPPMSVPIGHMLGLDLLINQARRSGGGGGGRNCVEIAEVTGVGGGTARLQTLFRWDSMRRRLVRTSGSSRLRSKICESARMSVTEFETVLTRRVQMLEDGVRTGATNPELEDLIRLENENSEVVSTT